MAGDHKGDVDRAMAAFDASPMRYSNFATAPSAPAGAARIVGGEATAEVRPTKALAFPLLIAALPGLDLSRTPAFTDWCGYVAG
jgi:hypothetical protein